MAGNWRKILEKRSAAAPQATKADWQSMEHLLDLQAAGPGAGGSSAGIGTTSGMWTLLIGMILTVGAVSIYSTNFESRNAATELETMVASPSQDFSNKANPQEPEPSQNAEDLIGKGSQESNIAEATEPTAEAKAKSFSTESMSQNKQSTITGNVNREPGLGASSIASAPSAGLNKNSQSLSTKERETPIENRTTTAAATEAPSTAAAESFLTSTAAQRKISLDEGPENSKAKAKTTEAPPNALAAPNVAQGLQASVTSENATDETWLDKGSAEEASSTSTGQGLRETRAVEQAQNNDPIQSSNEENEVSASQEQPTPTDQKNQEHKPNEDKEADDTKSASDLDLQLLEGLRWESLSSTLNLEFVSGTSQYFAPSLAVEGAWMLKNWRFQTGFSYGQWWEKSGILISELYSTDTSFSFTVDTNEVSWIDSSWVVTGVNQGQYVYDTNTTVISDTTFNFAVDSTLVFAKQAYPMFQISHRFAVPLLVSYRQNFGQFYAEAGGGVFGRFTSYQANNRELTSANGFSVDLILRPSLGYQFSDRWSAEVRANYFVPLYQSSIDQQFFSNQSRWSLGVGLRYFF